MISAPEGLIDDFSRALQMWDATPPLIEHFLIHPPHANREMSAILRGDSYIVYAFSLAGGDTVLKVGMAGPNSAARVLSQHYLPHSSPSNLAKQIVASPHRHPDLGAVDLEEKSIGAWIRNETDRDLFRIRTTNRDLALMFESYLRLRTGAMFENFSGTPPK
jgi:hypothetical protein